MSLTETDEPPVFDLEGGDWVTFIMADGDRRVNCHIPEASLDIVFGGERILFNAERAIAKFQAHKSEIEAAASKKYDKMSYPPTGEYPSFILVTADDLVPPKPAPLPPTPRRT